MKKRIFLYGFINFPRGSAGANYIQYLSQALKETEYDVYIITNLNKGMNFKEEEGHIIHKGIKVVPFNLSKNKVLHYMEFHYWKGHILVNTLKKFNVTEKDIILLYSPESYIHKEILKYKRKVGFKTVSCVVEWYPDSFFRSKQRKKAYNIYFEDLLPQHDLVLPISELIEKQLNENGCKTMRLPIMADVYEYPVGVKSFDKMRFIFPGNGLMKDAIGIVLQSFSQLSLQEKKRVELHLCGINQEQIKKILTQKEIDSLQGILTVHKFMPYEELIELYQSMHFLILAREKNQMTLANFPSKVPEVMCYGVVPIVSRVGDYTKYYLKNGVNSLILEGCDIKQCLGGIRRALSMKPEEFLRLSIRSRECAENDFDYRNWKRKIQNALESM